MAEIDQLFYTVSAEIDRASVGRAQSELKKVRRTLAGGKKELEEFGGVGSSAARRLAEGMDEAQGEAKETERSVERLTDETKELGDEGGRAGGLLAGGFSKARLAVAAVVSALVGSRIVGVLREAASNAIELSRSFLRLQASAKLFGVEQADIVRLAEEAKQQFRLTVRESNNLAVELTKLTARAGQTEKAQQALAAALDLGAAQGLTAGEVAESLRQALRGLDEGTDKLLQKNPSQIFADYADQIGKSAGALTDAEQKQALLNAVIEAGGRVQGEYERFLESNIGELATWERSLRAAREEIGLSMLPVLAEMADVLQGPLKLGVEVATGFFDAINNIVTTPLERLVAKLRETGEVSLQLARAQTVLRRRQLEEERRTLQEAAEEVALLAPAAQEAGLPGAARGREVGGPVASRQEVVFDLTTVGDDRIAQSIDQLESRINVINEEIIGATEGQAEALERQRTELEEASAGLAEILAQRERERDIARELQATEEDLASIREGSIPPSFEPPEAGGGADPREEFVDPLISGLEEATDRHREFVAAFRAGQEEIGLEGFIDHLSEVSRILAESATDSDALRESLEGLVDVEEGPGGMVQPLQDVTDRLRRFKELAEEIVRSDASGGVRTLHLEQALDDLGLTFDQLRPTTVRWLQLWGIYINLMGEGADATSDAKDEAEGLEAVMSDFEGAARGVLSVADAAGVLSDELREVLRGAIDVADALQSIAEEGLTIGNIAQGLGGVVGLVSGIAGALPFGESERDKAVRENTRALRELRRNIDQLSNLVSSRSGDLIEGLREVFDVDPERFRGFAESEAIFRQGPGGIPDFILQRMEEAGVSISDLERLAEDAGIDIDELTRLLEGEDLSVDEVRAATEQFLALQAAVNEIDLENLTKTVEGVQSMIEATIEMFDLGDDPAAMLEIWRDFFLRFTNLPEEMVEEAESFDLDTAEGRAAFEAWLQGVFQMVREGELPEGFLGDMDVDEFIQSLLRLEGLIDQAEDAAEGPASESFQIFRGITELRASRIEGALTSIDLVSRKQLGELISIREVLGGAEPGDVPILEPPSTGGNGLTPPPPTGHPPPPEGPGVTGGGASGPPVDGPVIQVDVARLEAPVSIDGALTPTGEELAQVVARELGRGGGGALLRELQKQLGKEFQGVDDALGRIRQIVQ